MSRKPRGTIEIDGEVIDIATLPVDEDGNPVYNGQVLKKVRKSSKSGKKGKGSKKKRKKRLSDYLPILGLLIAVGILVYPIITDLVQQALYGDIIATGESTFDYDTPEFQAMWQQAVWYNQQLVGILPDDVDPNDILPYEEQLDYNPSGMISWLEVSVLNIKIPVYRDATEESLMAGAAHVSTTSLPVGGTSTKTVISAHTGMASQKAFDDIQRLEEGDYITLHTLGKDIWYTVTYQEIVEPTELDKLVVEDDGKSEVILLTCYPYSINSHRLLVHGEQTDVPPPDLSALDQVVNYAKGRNALPFVILVGVLLLVGLVFLLLAIRRRKKRKQAEELEAAQATTPTLNGDNGENEPADETPATTTTTDTSEGIPARDNPPTLIAAYWNPSPLSVLLSEMDRRIKEDLNHDLNTR